MNFSSKPTVTVTLPPKEDTECKFEFPIGSFLAIEVPSRKNSVSKTVSNACTIEISEGACLKLGLATMVPPSSSSGGESTTTLFLSSPGVNDNVLQLCSFHHQESNYTHTFHNLEVSGKRKQCIWARSNQKGSSIHLFGSVVLDPILFLPSTVSDKFLTSETNSGISSSSSNVVEIQQDKEEERKGEDGEKSDEKRVSKKMRKIEAKKKQKELQEKIAKEQGYNTTNQSEVKKKSKKRPLPEEEQEEKKESGDGTDNANKDSSEPSSTPNNKKKRRKLTTPYSERRLNGGIKIKDIIIGDGNLVKTGKAVQILYKGYLEEDGKVFDKKQNKKDPLIFRLGTGEVIRGLEIGLEGMRVNGERTVSIPSNLGYGKKGAGDTIPPNANLVFDVKLIGTGNKKRS